MSTCRTCRISLRACFSQPVGSGDVSRTSQVPSASRVALPFHDRQWRPRPYTCAGASSVGKRFSRRRRVSKHMWHSSTYPDVGVTPRSPASAAGPPRTSGPQIGWSAASSACRMPSASARPHRRRRSRGDSMRSSPQRTPARPHLVALVSYPIRSTPTPTLHLMRSSTAWTSAAHTPRQEDNNHAIEQRFRRVHQATVHDRVRWPGVTRRDRDQRFRTHRTARRPRMREHPRSNSPT